MNWVAKQYSRIWCLSIGYHYILYLKELTGLVRRVNPIFHRTGDPALYGWANHCHTGWAAPRRLR
jgi:hypothetical protein